MINDTDGNMEAKSQALFDTSVQRVDMRVQARLNQARHAALDAVPLSRRQRWVLPWGVWTPAAGVAVAALLGMALWVGVPSNHGVAGGDQSSLEVLDIVAASDTGSGDALEMLQDDIEFYDFADKVSNPEPAA